MSFSLVPFTRQLVPGSQALSFSRLRAAAVVASHPRFSLSAAARAASTNSNDGDDSPAGRRGATLTAAQSPLPSSSPSTQSTSPPTTPAQVLDALAAAGMLPPRTLYRRLLRAHRVYLDPGMRVLGDRYVKAEFRAHSNIENPLHIIGFLTEWQKYLRKIEGDLWRDGKLEDDQISKFSEEQVAQLYELMKATKQL